MLFECKQPLLICHRVLDYLLDDTQRPHNVRNADFFLHLLILAGVQALSRAHFAAFEDLVDDSSWWTEFAIEADDVEAAPLNLAHEFNAFLGAFLRDL